MKAFPTGASAPGAFRFLKSATIPAKVVAMRLAFASAFLMTAAIAASASAQSRHDSRTSTADECATEQGPLPTTWEGLAYAIDGNMLAGIDLKPRIRIWGILAPELRKDEIETVPGMRARAEMEDILAAGEHRVSCKVAKFDRYCRIVAQCTVMAEWPTGSVAQPHDIGLRMIEDGMAYGFSLDDALPWDKDASEKIAHFEAISRQAHKGLWPIWLGEK
jgi:endonuclease YncB( thermonuclease family)